MTGSEFLSYVKQKFKRTDKDTEIYTATADTIMDIRSRFESDEHMTISSVLSGISAAGDFTLTTPSDFGHLVGDIQILDTDSDTGYLPLNKITKEQYDIKYSQNQASTAANRHTGVPLDYAYYSGTFYLGPAVDGTNYQFKINYTTEDTPTITSSTDPVPFTDQFREVVREGTLFRMYSEMELYQEASVHEERFERGIRRIEKNDAMSTRGSSQGVEYSGI